MITDSNIAYQSFHMNPKLPIKIIKQFRDKDSQGYMLHWHEQLELYYIVEGSVRIICNGQESTLHPGDVGFINWFEPHRGIEFSDNTVFYTVLIDLELIDQGFLEWHSEFLIKSHHAIPTFIKQPREITRILDELIHELESKEVAYPFIVKSSVYNILGRLIRMHNKAYPNEVKKMPASLNIVRGILKYISSHYKNPISLELLAKEFAFSKSHLCHIFKEYTNLTIHQYINEIRCRHAASLIMNNIPLSEVYQEVGFNNYNYFSRIFKNIYGIRPSDVKLKGLAL